MARWCKKVEYETSLCPHNLSQWACPFLAPNSMDWQKQQHFESPVTLPQIITLPCVTKPRCLLEESSSPPPASLSSSLFCHVRVASRAEQGVTSVMTCVNAPWSGFFPSPVSLPYSQSISKINLSHSTLVSGSAAGTTQPKAVPWAPAKPASVQMQGHRDLQTYWRSFHSCWPQVPVGNR